MQQITSGLSEPADWQNQPFAAAILAAGTGLFSITLLSIAKTFALPSTTSMAIVGVGSAIPLIAILIAKAAKQDALVDWLCGSLLISLLFAGIWVLPDFQPLPTPMIWGVITALSLALAIFAGSRICLILCAGISLIWCWQAYAANPPADFLWPALLVFALGITWAKRQQNPLAKLLFVLALLLWSALSAQVAIASQIGGTAPIALTSALFLLTTCLLIKATQSQRARIGPDHLLLIVASALAAGFAFSPFSSPAPIASTGLVLFLWLLLAALLSILSLIALAKSRYKAIDRIGLFGLLVLLLATIFITPNASNYLWWLIIGTSSLAVAGIWLSARGFADQNPAAGFGGLMIWGGSILLSSQGIEDQWLRVIVLALYSISAVGFYLAAERQYLTNIDKTRR